MYIDLGNSKTVLVQESHVIIIASKHHISATHLLGQLFSFGFSLGAMKLGLLLPPSHCHWLG